MLRCLLRRVSSPWLTSIALLSCGAVEATDWQDGETIEQFLSQADVIQSTELADGITGSLRLTLERDGRTHQAIFKDFDRTSDSWRREVAAYEFDKLIGLGMVPPTVERKHRGRRGCLQLWVEGTTLDRAAPPADLSHWRRQVSEMWLFDYLTGNIDRHVRNALMTPDQRLVLIDNSKAFQVHPQILPEIDDATGATRARLWMEDYDPSQTVYATTYRQEFLDGLRFLSRESLKQAIGRWVDAPERRSLLERRGAVLDRLGERQSTLRKPGDEPPRVEP